MKSFAIRSLAALALFLVAVPAFAQTDACYHLANGGVANISSPDGTCRKVTNSTGNALCVVNTSNGEFYSDTNSFVNHPPSGVSVAACVTCTWQVSAGGAGNTCPSGQSGSCTSGTPSCTATTGCYNCGIKGADNTAYTTYTCVCS